MKHRAASRAARHVAATIFAAVATVTAVARGATGATAPLPLSFAFPRSPASSTSSCASSSPLPSRRFSPSSISSLSSSMRAKKDGMEDGGSGVEGLRDALDADLANEIEEALSLARAVLNVDETDGEDTVAARKSGMKAAAPEEEPLLSFLSGMFGDDTGEVDAPSPPKSPPPERSADPAPPKSPPTSGALDFGEIFRAALTKEADRLMDGLDSARRGLMDVESRTRTSDDAAAKLRDEIEKERKEREEFRKEVEEQFNAEMIFLSNEFQNATVQLEEARALSEADVAAVEKEKSRVADGLRSKIDDLTNSVTRVSSDVAESRSAAERIAEEREARLAKARDVKVRKMDRLRMVLADDLTRAQSNNEKWERKAQEAEGRLKDVADGIVAIRDEREGLQRQIEETETNALARIEELEKKTAEDDKYYAEFLKKERSRVDLLITEANQTYDRSLEKEREKRRVSTEGYDAKLVRMESEGRATVDAVRSSVKLQLDELEKKNKEKRDAAYRSKAEGIADARRESRKILAIEGEKLEAIRVEGRERLKSARLEVTAVQDEFRREIKDRRRAADVERIAMLAEIDDVRAKYAAQSEAQREEMAIERTLCIRQGDLAIGKSDEESRRMWVELAKIRGQSGEAKFQAGEIEQGLKLKSDLIESHEIDSMSFRKTLRLTLSLAKKKIGKGTRRLLRRPEKSS